jgi:nitrite reductase/ring-hydroxylating ferredoxin subunit
MISTRLGSFIVNIGHYSKIPRGKARVFQIGDTSIAVFHTPTGNVHATEPTCPRKGGSLTDSLVEPEKIICPLHGCTFDLRHTELKTYPAVIDEEGNILVGIEAVWAAKRRTSMSFIPDATR